MKRTIRGLILMGKLGATGVAIGLIALAFGVLEPDGTVSESEADILALGFGEQGNHEKMSSALDFLGHSKPWPLNINGNVVYFSTKTHRAEPKSVMEDYLRAFHDVGINRVDYTRATDQEAYDATALDALSGGVIPLEMTEDHVVLGGVQTREEADTEDELKSQFEAHSKQVNDDNWHRIFKGFRHIEMDRTGPGTQVTSVWSDDEDFDFGKMQLGSKASEVNTDPDLPACPGCMRLNGFESLDTSRLYKSAIYVGSGFAISDVRSFYERALGNRGWEPTEANEMMKNVRKHVTFEGSEEAEMLQFAQGDKFMTVMIASRENQYVATLAISD